MLEFTLVRASLSRLLKISLILGVLVFLTYKFVIPVFQSYNFQGTLGINIAETDQSKPHPAFDTLSTKIQSLTGAKKSEGSVTLIEIGGNNPESWNFQGDKEFIAASTFKLPLLMREAELIAKGQIKSSDRLCYLGRDFEPGYFGDYKSGSCFTRQELARRVGKYSDNTAAHILIRYAGGGAVLNQYASQHGAKDSRFYDPNVTTCNDLANLWLSEVRGQAGGKSAQNYLYPNLSETFFEAGIPAGTPKGTEVIHKIGILGSVVNDAALIKGGPSGDYILTICTRGPGGWGLVASISQAVWEFESQR